MRGLLAYIFGGLMVSQLLTVFTTPVVYLYFDRVQRALAKHGWGVGGSPDTGAQAEG